ncbi:hypothetical protein B0J11DRAFT_309766 [Dendryphion nanum]|uniref:Uncharacterized protein n=1 Tax=Dendryphion nanum TaxID=256645 RepID=A0A9P9IKH1_9PLEO|nr:hypothetical protein B0J11DRAFT_309766 [Dendryphion nanum]
MEGWGPQHVQLDARSHFNMTLNTSAVREVPWTAQNSSRALIASLQLQQVQTLRTMHLTLGAFSLALMLLTVHRIISDAKRTSAVQVPLRKQRFNLFHNVHTAETFPLVLACGAVLQQIIFVAVQSTSLHSVLSNKCRGLSMITLPAIFITGYATLVFGVEMSMRAFKFDRFSPRGRWNTPICVGCIAFLLLLTWMPTIVWPMYNRCFGSLIWFPMRYELIMICILVILIFFFLFLAALISIQLMRTAEVDPNERIAASRMCYYLLMAALVYTLVLPVEIQAHRRDFMNTLATSRIAEISLFTSGIFYAFFHLFLRVNATRLVIKPNKESSQNETKQKRPRIRFFGPSDLEMNISGPLALQGGRLDSRQGLIDVGPEKNRFDFDGEYFTRSERPLTPGSMKSLGSIDPTKWPLPPAEASYSEDVKESAPGLHKRAKSSYSLFPTRAEDIPRLPATVYSPNENRVSKLALRRQTRRSSLGGKSVTDVTECFNFLSKPAPLFSRRHRRDESTDSSATVQIGLRFSVAPATLAAATCTAANRERTPSVPFLRRDNSDSSGVSLGLPIQAPSLEERPKRDPSPGRTPAFPVSSTQNSGAYLQQQRDKLLPPTPSTTFPAPPIAAQTVALRASEIMSGLRMNPVSPASTTTTAVASPRSATNKSPTARSPTARIPLGAGTMARSPPPNGWI